MLQVEAATGADVREADVVACSRNTDTGACREGVRGQARWGHRGLGLSCAVGASARRMIFLQMRQQRRCRTLTRGHCDRLVGNDLVRWAGKAQELCLQGWTSDSTVESCLRVAPGQPLGHSWGQVWGTGNGVQDGSRS